MATAQQIRDKALELGFTECGIVKIETMRDYEEKIKQRISRFPQTEPYYTYLSKFSRPDEAEASAKSVIVCAGRYGKYKVPRQLQGRIGKYYLADFRTIPESEEYQATQSFEAYLTESGISFKKDIHGISAGRFAAAKSGIGLIRRNNFLYTRFGSWVWLETWLVDRELELIHQCELPPCPDDCHKCIETCGTHALAEPYQTNAFHCTSMLTWGGLPNTLPPEELRLQMKGWVYGCDDCQDCCPMNHGCWTEEDDFPGIDALQQYLTLEQLCLLDTDAIVEKLSPLFWYIGSRNAWKWKVNALRAMAYEYKEKYLSFIQNARTDENALVREMADWVYEVTR